MKLSDILDMIKISEAGIKFIMDWEGFRSKAYQDSKGVWTIGYGTTWINNKPVKEGMTITAAYGKTLLLEQLDNNYARRVSTACNMLLMQNEFDAMVSLCYNIGVANFLSSTLLKKVKGDYSVEEAAREFLRWNKIRKNGKLVISSGLTNRRTAEMKLFLTPYPLTVEEQLNMIKDIQPRKLDIIINRFTTRQIPELTDAV